MADEPKTGAIESDPRVYFAAERTYLAWIRTGLALMGIGFAVSRFGLFLREFAVAQTLRHEFGTSHSVFSGVVLVVLGVIVNIAATLRYARLVRQLGSGQWIPGRLSKEAVILALLLAVAGIAMAVFLLLVRS